jgi:hypothetical protein
MKRLIVAAVLICISSIARADAIYNPGQSSGGLTVGAPINGTCPNGYGIYSNAGTVGCETASSSGTVTSVAESFTGGLLSIAGSPITTSGTFAWTVAGTSGGIPYFSSATTWASSGALTANTLILGGGAGSSPTSLAAGQTAQVLHGNPSGAPTWSPVALSTDLSGVLAIGNGGTAHTTAPVAFTALAPLTTQGDIIVQGVTNAGRLAIGTASQFLLGGTTTPVYTTMAGDCTFATPNITCLSTNGTAFGTFATQNFATPPAIGGTTPAAGAFTTLTASASLTDSGNLLALRISGTGGSPTLSACGTSPTNSTGSSRVNDTVTEGTGATGCTVSFPAFTNAPNCVVEFTTGIQATTSWTTSTTTLVVTNTSAGTFTYVCLGT